MLKEIHDKIHNRPIMNILLDTGLSSAVDLIVTLEERYQINVSGGTRR